ncbi:hypothetical protein [Nocardioides currus]|uniref:Glycosyltransferase RgtA/B/C/D-like domain-containing protein n=1 Tax=Nocardioides currus TaxID=2133958 RepID=A0A2R7YZF5_9ACTN|nr:hypothetical protein [Nocardioides currus]PUA81753.1 hypothetical protein C7S10_06715 [Nocardioides currus]
MPLTRPTPRAVVALSMVAAVLGRIPSLQWPMRPDEAGFLLVARAWHPEPDSMFGTYWVDRPPPIIALFKLSDWIGGPYFIRVVAAVAAAVFVLAAAGTARRLADYAGARGADRIGAWVAVATAALTSQAAIDSVAAKGEILGLPVVMGACWFAIGALMRRSVWHAGAAGLLAVLAIGLKQNLFGGLVFGGVLLLGALLTKRLDRRDFTRLAGAALAGGTVPVLAVVGWGLVVGVRLSTLAFVTFGFRVEASEVLAQQPSSTIDARIHTLFLITIVSGLGALMLWFVLRVPRLVRRSVVPTAAVAAMLVVDSAGVFLSGSYWRTYLLVPIAPAVLALGLLLADEQLMARHWRHWIGLTTRVLVAFTVVSSAVSVVEWERTRNDYLPTEYLTGRAIGEAAQPGDTLVAYGGRADIQWASGLRSPYEHLWSLPMRTLDPDLDELGAILTGPDAPTWFVQSKRLDEWSEAGTDEIREELLEDYELVSIACGAYRIYHQRRLVRPELEVDCDQPFDRLVPIFT